MSWHALSLRLLRILPPGDRVQLEAELATVLENTAAHQGVDFKDTASIGSLVIQRWAVVGLANIGLAISVLLAAVAAAALGFVALAAHQLHGWVNTSLPCEPTVLTETDTLIDPWGYYLYSEREVSASQAWDACMADSRALLAAGGTVGRANLLYWPSLVVINVLSAVAVVVALSRKARHPAGSAILKLPAAIGVAAFTFQIIYAETIDVITVIVE